MSQHSRRWLLAHADGERARKGFPKGPGVHNAAMGTKLSEAEVAERQTGLPTSGCFRCGARGWCGCSVDRRKE